MSSSTASVSTISVILNGPADWVPWLECLKTVATTAKIWEYVNPDLPVRTEWIEPQRPTPTMVRSLFSPNSVLGLDTPSTSTMQSMDGTAVTYGQLTAEEREYYRQVQEEYMYERKKYDKRDEALDSLRSTIQKTINRELLPYTYKCNTPYEMLTKLKTRFAPTDRGRELKVTDKWRALQKSLTAQDQ
jgi:hypothetical protein